MNADLVTTAADVLTTILLLEMHCIEIHVRTHIAAKPQQNPSAPRKAAEKGTSDDPALPADSDPTGVPAPMLDIWLARLQQDLAVKSKLKCISGIWLQLDDTPPCSADKECPVMHRFIES